MQARQLLSASLVVISLVSACSLVNTQRRDDSFTVSGPARLEGNVAISQVMVHGATSGQLRIQATLRHARETVYRATQSGDTVRIEVETATGLTSSAGQPAVEVVATVPRNTELDLTNSTGDIYVDEITGPIALATSSGSLQLSDCSGRIELTNQTGTIQCRRVVGTHVIRSTAGSVILSDVEGVFDVETASGDIDLEGQLVGQGEHRLLSETGAIEVNLLGSPSLRLNASSETGLVRCILSLQDPSISDYRCTGLLGGGDATLQVRTSTGRITLR